MCSVNYKRYENRTMINLAETLIEDGAIRVKKHATNWQDAIKIGIGCLVKAGKVRWGYYDSILESVQKNGMYFVLMPGVALPHARPNENVLSSGFSLVTLEQPVNFGSPENDPISILLSFAATDAKTQVEGLLTQAVTLFEEQEHVDRLQHATTLPQIHSCLRSVDFSAAEE